jgi:hypothetical protein
MDGPVSTVPATYVEYVDEVPTDGRYMWTPVKRSVQGSSLESDPCDMFLSQKSHCLLL